MSDVGLSPGIATAILATLILILVGIVLAAFLIGSIPFGYLIGRFFFRTDIRKQGSGNIGAMNALRALGRGGAVAVLLLDFLKGFVPTILALWFFREGGAGHLDLDFEGLPPGAQIIASLVATSGVLGHCYSPWLRFRGGKGVATSFGAIFAFSWPAGLIAAAGWMLGVAVTRYSSVGSIFGCMLAPFAIFFFTRSLPETAYALFAAALILFKHRENIARLRAGKEGPIQFSKP